MPNKCKNSQDGCQRNADLNHDGLCGVCHRVTERLQQARGARDQVVNDRRNLGGQPPDLNNQIEFPGAAAAAIDLPALDMTKMNRLYQQVNNGEEVSNQELMSSAFSMMMHMATNMNKVNDIRVDVQKNKDRISALEAKVGSAEEVATQLGLAIQNLPLPTNGTSELNNARSALAEIRATNVDVNHAITKAVRKGFKAETRPGAGDAKLGTVLVEVSNVDVKSKIMKNKKVLENHTNPSIKNLKIKNMKTQEQLNYEFSTRQLLRMVPGGDGWYVAGNGRLNQVRPGGAGPRHPGVNQQHPPAFRPNVPPPAPRFPGGPGLQTPNPVQQQEQPAQQGATPAPP